MKVYTVQRMDKFDYDFSVEITNHGCFTNKADAIVASKKEFESMCAEYENKMKKYSDADIYPPDEYASGALNVEKDEKFGFYAICFGNSDDYECHSVSVDEWEMNTTLRDDLLVTAGSRAAYMEMNNIVTLPEGPDGEREISIVVARAVSQYINQHAGDAYDLPYDLFIESVLNIVYGKE